MKSKLKNIIIVTLILTILAIVAYIAYIKISYYISLSSSTTGIIVNIDDKIITIKNSIDTTEIKYEIYLDEKEPKVKNINGKKIELSNLNIGDKIKVEYRQYDYKIAYTPPRIYNVKSIQVIEDNSDNHLTKDDLSYNYYTVNYFISNGEELGLKINSKNFLSDEIKVSIIEKDSDIGNENQEIRHFENSELSLKEYEIGSADIILNNFKYKELENLKIGEYILRIENGKEDTIKIPFEINKSGTIQW